MHRLLLIEGTGTGTESGLHAALLGGAAFRCDRIGWDQLGINAPEVSDADMVIAVPDGGRQPLPLFLEMLRRLPPGKPILAVLPAETDGRLLDLTLQLVDDFIVGPPRTLELHHRIARLLTGTGHDAPGVCTRFMEELAATKLVGRDPAFLQAIEQLPRFARSEASVLITGETGTGKELCARAMHHLSRRRNCPFIAVECGAVPDQLFENELFGHARGAFTDAHRDQRGLVAMADGGTLFLDEIDALSLTAQGKVLRFLQEHSFRALGAERFDRADVKVIAATNRNLDTCVKDGRLRSDLYFRLNVLRVHLPPLRERASDIPLLACSVLNDCRAFMDSGTISFSAAALRLLSAHHWPGNVRELSNVVQRAAIVCDGDRILPCHIMLGDEPTTPTVGLSDRTRRGGGRVRMSLRRETASQARRQRDARRSRSTPGSPRLRAVHQEVPDRSQRAVGTPRPACPTTGVGSIPPS
jgi:DNA-binding NtrC family response regulator